MYKTETIQTKPKVDKKQGSAFLVMKAPMLIDPVVLIEKIRKE